MIYEPRPNEFVLELDKNNNCVIIKRYRGEKLTECPSIALAKNRLRELSNTTERIWIENDGIFQSDWL